MGCWNSTCGISNLPIFDGEKIRATFIQGVNYKLDRPFMHEEYDHSEDIIGGQKWREGWWSGYCHSDGIFFPRCVPLTGTYDDYGSIDHDESLNSKIVEWQFRDLCEVKKGEHGIPPEIKRGMPLPEIISAVQGDAVTVKTTGFETGKLQPAPVGLWMVREDIYQAIVNTVADDWGHETSKDRFRKMVPEYLDSVKKWSDHRSDKSDQDLSAIFTDIYEFARKTPFGGALNTIRSTGLYVYSDYLVDKISSGEMSIEDKAIEELALEMADFLFFQQAMSHLRVGFMPQPGAGSQDSVTDFHHAVAERVLDTIGSFNKEEY